MQYIRSSQNQSIDSKSSDRNCRVKLQSHNTSPCRHSKQNYQTTLVFLSHHNLYSLNYSYILGNYDHKSHRQLCLPRNSQSHSCNTQTKGIYDHRKSKIDRHYYLYCCRCSTKNGRFHKQQCCSHNTELHSYNSLSSRNDDHLKHRIDKYLLSYCCKNSKKNDRFRKELYQPRNNVPHNCKSLNSMSDDYSKDKIGNYLNFLRCMYSMKNGIDHTQLYQINSSRLLGNCKMERFVLLLKSKSNSKQPY